MPAVPCTLHGDCLRGIAALVAHAASDASGQRPAAASCLCLLLLLLLLLSRAFCLPNDLGLIIKVPNARGILMEKSSTNWLFQCQGEANVDQRTVRILRKHECSYEYSYEYSTVRLYRSTVLYGCTGVQYCTVVRVQYSCRSS